jgi:hypothetical protein
MEIHLDSAGEVRTPLTKIDHSKTADHAVDRMRETSPVVAFTNGPLATVCQGCRTGNGNREWFYAWPPWLKRIESAGLRARSSVVPSGRMMVSSHSQSLPSLDLAVPDVACFGMGRDDRRRDSWAACRSAGPFNNNWSPELLGSHYKLTGDDRFKELGKKVVGGLARQAIHRDGYSLNQRNAEDDRGGTRSVPTTF